MKKFLLLPLVFAGLVGFLPAKALAHAVETNYALLADEFQTEAEEFEIEAVYSTGEPLQQAAVKIYAPNSPTVPWMIGMTDMDGKFAFKPDVSIEGDWEVQIERDGHGDIITVPVTAAGIQMDNVSEAPTPFSTPLMLLGAIGLSGGIGTAVFVSRKSS